MSIALYRARATYVVGPSHHLLSLEGLLSFREPLQFIVISVIWTTFTHTYGVNYDGPLRVSSRCGGCPPLATVLSRGLGDSVHSEVVVTDNFGNLDNLGRGASEREKE
jgi:hypothetical protein